MVARSRVISLPHAYATDFDPDRTTSSHKLFVGYNNGERWTSKDYSTGSADKSLSPTGLTGTVIDAGDHWILDITGGNLTGYIHTDSGVEIRLNGCSVVLSVAGFASEHGIRAAGGVKIVGPGTLHIDQTKDVSAIYSATGGIATIVSGACVAINQLTDNSAIEYWGGIRIEAAALHVNSDGRGIRTHGSMAVSGSIVTVLSKRAALVVEGSLDISYSSVHLAGGGPAWLWTTIPRIERSRFHRAFFARAEATVAYPPIADTPHLSTM